jgi:NADPH:quinone reductase-like Zn-dependent oxidoreductase
VEDFMKAIQYDRHGGAEVLMFREVADPQPGRDQAVVQVAFAAVNHLDVHFRKGLPELKTPLPHIPGSDGAGIVESVGEGVASVRPGDRVTLHCGTTCGRCAHCHIGDRLGCQAPFPLGRDTDGTYAERVAWPAENLLIVPDGVSLEAAASAPLVYTTAWSMVAKAGIRPSDVVLVTAAGSGVGTAAIQICKLFGATVLATAGTVDKARRARELGADAVIVYTEAPLDREARKFTGGRGVDVVLDHVGGPQWQPLLRATRSGGTIVTCGATAGYDPHEDLRHIFYRHLRILGSSLGTPAEFLTVMQLVFAGRLSPVIDSVMQLSEAAQAHRQLEARQVFGKILLRP